MSLNLKAKHSDFTLIMTLTISFLVGILVTFYGNMTLSEYREQKEVCEQSLPRDQVCEMKLVVKGE